MSWTVFGSSIRAALEEIQSDFHLKMNVLSSFIHSTAIMTLIYTTPVEVNKNKKCCVGQLAEMEFLFIYIYISFQQKFILAKVKH